MNEQTKWYVHVNEPAAEVYVSDSEQTDVGFTCWGSSETEAAAEAKADVWRREFDALVNN